MKDKTADTTGTEQISAPSTRKEAFSGDGLKLYLEALRDEFTISLQISEHLEQTTKFMEELNENMRELIELGDPEKKKEKRDAISIMDKKLEELIKEQDELTAKYEESKNKAEEVKNLNPAIISTKSNTGQPRASRGHKRKHRQSTGSGSSTNQPNQNDLLQLEQDAASLGFRHIAPKPVVVIDGSPSIQNIENATALQPILDAPSLPSLNQILKEKNMPASLYALPTLQPLQAHPPIHEYFNKLREEGPNGVAEPSEEALQQVNFDSQSSLPPASKKGRYA